MLGQVSNSNDQDLRSYLERAILKSCGCPSRSSLPLCLQPPPLHPAPCKTRDKHGTSDDALNPTLLVKWIEHKASCCVEAEFHGKEMAEAYEVSIKTPFLARMKVF
ncbi:hypothetical protein G9A89_018248 [Geosiphon pyriformis]|nr:hypothetical protein G9A89_018248 [Geosiphon pyriformis]